MSCAAPTSEHVRGRKVGLLTHLSAVGEMLIPTYSLLTGSPEVDVRALFTPEHGFFGSARARASW
ncbi:MAG: DUF1343 domain-containing protein [Chloroflexi bacterium]|nr:DUF1343 domain-containing protein [Chloroflexota bacterium]